MHPLFEIAAFLIAVGALAYSIWSPIRLRKLGLDARSNAERAEKAQREAEESRKQAEAALARLQALRQSSVSNSTPWS